MKASQEEIKVRIEANQRRMDKRMKAWQVVMKTSLGKMEATIKAGREQMKITELEPN
jgi:hypothetical protein